MSKEVKSGRRLCVAYMCFRRADTRSLRCRVKSTVDKNAHNETAVVNDRSDTMSRRVLIDLKKRKNRAANVKSYVNSSK